VLTLRVCRLLTLPDPPFANPTEAERALQPLKLSRQKIGRALQCWLLADDRAALLRDHPRQFMPGRFGPGHFTETQKHDLAVWIRIREQCNASPHKPEVLSMIVRMMALNRGEIIPEDAEVSDEAFTTADHTYDHWRSWVTRNMPKEYRIKTGLSKPVASEGLRGGGHDSYKRGQALSLIPPQKAVSLPRPVCKDWQRAS